MLATTKVVNYCCKVNCVNRQTLSNGLVGLVGDILHCLEDDLVVGLVEICSFELCDDFQLHFWTAQNTAKDVLFRLDAVWHCDLIFWLFVWHCCLLCKYAKKTVPMGFCLCATFANFLSCYDYTIFLNINQLYRAKFCKIKALFFAKSAGFLLKIKS